MKKTMIMLCLALVSWGATAQHDHAAHGAQASSEKMEPMFKDKALGSSYTHYIHLKNALVASDFQQAKSASESLVKALHNVKGSDKVHIEAAKVAQAGSLENQRKAFTALSNEMAALVKSGKLTKGKIYLDYCPMAFNNQGAYWLSETEEIRNPYLGESMLKCGEVKEAYIKGLGTLEKKEPMPMPSGGGHNH